MLLVKLRRFQACHRAVAADGCLNQDGVRAWLGRGVDKGY